MREEIAETYRELVEWPPSENYTKLGLVVLWLPKTILGHWAMLMVLILFAVMLAIAGPMIALNDIVEKLDKKYGWTPRINSAACKAARKLSLLRRC